MILYHPLHAEFSPLHHPSYVDFFTDVLTVTTNPEQISADYEEKFANDSWYVHLYRTSQAFHGVHPIYLWYQIAAAQRHCSDIVWVGADRESAARLGCRAASTLADALEMVASTVGRAPSISYLHTRRRSWLTSHENGRPVRRTGWARSAPVRAARVCSSRRCQECDAEGAGGRGLRARRVSPAGRPGLDRGQPRLAFGHGRAVVDLADQTPSPYCGGD